MVGVAMPTKTSERWINDGDEMKKQLEAAGYKVDLQYADDDIPTQVTQLENMITKGARSPRRRLDRRHRPDAMPSQTPRTTASPSSPTTA